MENVKRHVFIIGAKGVGNYGGYETFIAQFLRRSEGREGVQYHVACKKNGTGAMDFEHLSGIQNDWPGSMKE
ncbi:MAG: DUF1972 domain-containing protein [Lachnospiraceae bacterium]|nr:DUF1972 domain-containing protein [Lachnospiraceae bacterium]